MDFLGFYLPLWLVLMAIAVYLWYRHNTHFFDIFKKMGIDGPEPTVGMGTLGPLMKLGTYKHDLMMREKYGKLVGSFHGRVPVLIVYDLDILKQVLIKDFNVFRNRYTLQLNDYPLDRMVQTLHDDHWKHVRNLLTPTFSGKKLRTMIPYINRCGHNLVQNLNVAVKAGDAFECKEYAGSYTTDVIASTLFSLDVDSQRDKNNQFVRMAHKAFNHSMSGLIMFLIFFFPFLVPYMGKIGLRLFSKEATEFFTEIVTKAIKDREDNPDESPKDFLQMMLRSHVEDIKPEDATKENDEVGIDHTGVWSKKGLTLEEILGNSMIFFLAGYDTNSSAIALTMYNLATHPDVQDKAYNEIMSLLGPQDDPSYDQMKKLTYLQMCVEETLRMYPPAPRMDRVAQEDTKLGGLDIPEGMTIGLPIYALHMDPEAWTDPEMFDPERFTPEAKEARHPCQYLPFGVGPRGCIGLRLALLETKMSLVHILKNFKLVTCEKTQIPLELKKTKAEAVNGTWLKAEPRH